MAALVTALMVGTTPCLAADSTALTAAESTSASSPAAAAPASSLSVAEAVAGPIEATKAIQIEGSKEENNLPGAVTPTPATPVLPMPLGTEAPLADPAAQAHDHWQDTVAKRGEAVTVKFTGDATFKDLDVKVSTPFQNFHTRVEADQSITVFVPRYFTGASKVAPVFTVSDDTGEIDTFSLTVEYPRPLTEEDEASTPLFRVISEMAIRLPQVPFLRYLFED